MKVLLVATNRERSPYPVAPLGVLCVASATRAAGHEVEFLDLGLVWAPERTLRRKLKQGDFQAVAFGIRNLDNCWAFAPEFYAGQVAELLDTARRCFDGPIILGGSGFSVSPRGWMERLQPDYGIIGEGEKAFPELLKKLEQGDPMEGIPGVITRWPVEELDGPAPPRALESLDGMPLPAHELCHYFPYVRRGGFVGVQTKRGCPFKCAYCVYPQLEGRRYRLRPPEAVAEEVERIAAEKGMRHFFFVDSVFNDPPAHAHAICAELDRRRLPIQWSAFCNPAGFDRQLAQAMAHAGCGGVEFGLDVASPRMLETLGKPFGQRETRIALQAARDAGLPFAIYLLFGGPGETWADVEETQTFLNKCAPANAVFASFGIRVFEGTPLAEVARKEGVVGQNQDLFEPAYYLSPFLADNTEEKLDRIARRRAEWTSPADWRRPVTRLGQKITVLLNVRPQWKHLRGYGEHMR